MNDIEIIKTLHQWHSESRSCVLAVVIETWGSAPRRAGSMLAIDSNGNFAGSVSGGCVEGAVIGEAQAMLEKNEKAKILEFGVADETAWQVGLSCGGKIKIHLLVIGKDILENLIQAHKQRKHIALVYDLQTGEVFINPDFLTNKINEHIKKGICACVEYEKKQYFIHTHIPAPRLVMVGAVHISQHLYKMANLCGFETLIIDPRTAFATAERFSGTKLIADWPQNVFSQMALDEFTAFVALSHDPKIDDPPLIKAIEKKCFYIGALGSKKTHASRLQRLKTQGISDTDCANINAPIGLDIGATSPSEIAVAILAQIIEKQRNA